MSDFQRRSGEVGRAYEAQVAESLTEQGWEILDTNIRHASGIQIDILALDLDRKNTAVECKGPSDDPAKRGGLRRTDNLWKALGQTLTLLNWNRSQPPSEHLRFVVIASEQPADDEPMAKPLRVAELNGQLTIVVVPSEGADE